MENRHRATKAAGRMQKEIYGAAQVSSATSTAWQAGWVGTASHYHGFHREMWGENMGKTEVALGVLLNLIPPMITPVYCVMGKYGSQRVMNYLICAIAVQTALLVPSTSAGFRTISLVPFVFLGESIAQPLQHLDSEFIPKTRQSNGSNSGTTTCAEPEAFAASTQPFTQRKLQKVRVALTASLLGLWF